MNKYPLISVLMGIYNCSDTLETAVQCIINQTYSNWELIMCDDCSDDNTLEIAKKLASKDKRIIILHNNRNLTLAPTLNVCLSVARGDYIARMDGDDVCELNRFEKELCFLEKNPQYAFVSCNMDLFDSNGIYKTIVHPEIPTKTDLIKKSQFCHAGCMIRSEAIHKLDGYSESINRQRVEDYDLWIRMYSKGYMGYNIQESLYAMRDDRNALHRRTFRNRINEFRVKYDACKRFDLSLKSYFLTLVPIIKIIVPSCVYKIIHKK